MKKKKNTKQRITEMAYGRKDIQRKVTMLEKAVTEVSNILNDKK
ncbi:MAG: hypothetical protein RSD28_05180 [Lachnospiraceae bacterium]